jgi:hypothetical protein
MSEKLNEKSNMSVKDSNSVRVVLNEDQTVYTLNHNGETIVVATIDDSVLRLTNVSDLAKMDMTAGAAGVMQARAIDCHTIFSELSGLPFDETIENEASTIETATFFDDNKHFLTTSSLASLFNVSDATIRRRVSPPDGSVGEFGKEWEGVVSEFSFPEYGWIKAGKSYAVHVYAVKAYKASEDKKQEAARKAREQEAEKLNDILALLDN